MVIGLFCNSIFGVLMTTFLVMKVLSSVLRPARSIFRAEFLGSKSQSFLHIEIYFWLSQDHEYGYLQMHRKPAQAIVLIVAVKV